MNYILQRLGNAKKSDMALFADMESKLPSYPTGWPGGLMGHSIDALRMICEILKPKSILEIGFNMGRSSMMWLHLTQATLKSVDICQADNVHAAAEAVKRLYPDRFSYLICAESERDDLLIQEAKAYDMIFIDGGHDLQPVIDDVSLAKRLGIRRIVFDDWDPHFGPGVQGAIEHHNLQVMAIFGNIAYCENTQDSPDW